jgi:hypothetical protein
MKRWNGIWLCALLVCTAEGATPDCADDPAPAPPRLALRSVAEKAHEPLRGFDRALQLGVGHLRPVREEDQDDWLDSVLMPLAARPGEPVAMWLSAGWILPANGGPPRRVGVRGAVETGYETVSLIVLEVNDDGWLRIRFDAGDEASSTGWLDPCHLQHLRPKVAYEPWERLFAREDISPLYFRTGGPRALRRAPAPAEEAVAWIPAEGRKYAIEPLEFKGDWMRARLKVPSDYCRDSGIRPVIREGWIRWRDPTLGPLVWYHTRGC